ncbi:sulfurtransferase [Rufibacter glacialis]|uniref:Sulfurtransferase n=1 Tax=Rufibacter glacialis TaxID=1259555 RepID=A0A5M8QLH9_9BACT|nr:sulfurtransferase [Rufibacter glacialis]KAA6435830.1 sulfurtransferase [Rufibacter glacialis]GGK66958.1 thiosulfate sulfurtransferase [Rufibacter glacialis]
MVHPIIDPQELVSLANAQEVILIDARQGPEAFDQYQQEHLARARYVDLEKDLAAVPQNAAQGGRHPLPPIQQFAAYLGGLGITPSSRVVVYDDKAGANAAARFWWMLKAVGHANVQVVDGGFQAAKQAGFPVHDAVPAPTPAPAYPVTDWQRPTADLEEVARVAGDKEHLVIDVRDAYRYLGESEPIDPVAGHIPGAVNVPLTGNLVPDGRFLPAPALQEKYRKVLQNVSPEQVIVHCGSGVTACHTLLALESAGISGAKLYVGSWSEWCRNDQPIGTAKDFAPKNQAL